MYGVGISHYIQMTTPKNTFARNLRLLFESTCENSEGGFRFDDLKHIFLSENIYMLIEKTQQHLAYTPQFIWSIDCSKPFPLPDDDPRSKDQVIAVANGTKYTIVISLARNQEKMWYRMFHNNVREAGDTDGLMYAMTQHWQSHRVEGDIILATIRDSVFVSIVEHYGRVAGQASLESNPRILQNSDVTGLSNEEKMENSKVYVETKIYKLEDVENYTEMTYSATINRTDDPEASKNWLGFNPFEISFSDNSEPYYRSHHGCYYFADLLDPETNHYGYGQEVPAATDDIEWNSDPWELLDLAHELGSEKEFPILKDNTLQLESEIAEYIFRDLCI
jgi:hypothetical protein